MSARMLAAAVAIALLAAGCGGGADGETPASEEFRQQIEAATESKPGLNRERV
ncbi:MAG: hypothetical protein ACRDL1_10035 [Solirubrobacterales bacterium]